MVVLSEQHSSAMSQCSSHFMLAGTDAKFQQRSRLVFDSLSAEEELRASTPALKEVSASDDTAPKEASITESAPKDARISGDALKESSISDTTLEEASIRDIAAKDASISGTAPKEASISDTATEEANISDTGLEASPREAYVSVAEQVNDAMSFKKPVGTAPKTHHLPAHREQPSRWQHYDLSDITCCSSDAANTAAAMEFLWSRKRQHEVEANTSLPDSQEEPAQSNRQVLSCNSRHKFRKPNKIHGSSVKHLSETNDTEESGGPEHKNTDVLPVAYHWSQAVEDSEVNNQMDNVERDINTGVAFKAGRKKCKCRQHIRRKSEGSESSENEDKVS